MAMSATISLSPATVLINQPVNAALTVSNSGGTAVNVLSIQPTAIFTGGSVPAATAAAFGEVNLGPGAIVSVPASGSTVFSFQIVFFAPSTGPIGAGSGTYSVAAQVSTSDGSNFSPTAATVTVNPIALPTAEQ